MTIKQSIVVNTIRLWVPIAVAVTLTYGIIYIVAQQSMRAAANHPQIEIAEQAAARLANNEQATTIATGLPVDLEHDSSPFIIVYDTAGNVLTSTGKLRGDTPRVPEGVLEYAREHGQHHVAWEPQQGVRTAIVVKHYNGIPSGYVVVGKSLQETETLTYQIGLITIIAWLITLCSVFVAANAGALLAEWAQRSVTRK